MEIEIKKLESRSIQQEEDNKKMQDLNLLISSLQRFEIKDISEIISELISDIEDLTVEKSTKLDEIDEIKEKGIVDEGEYRNLFSKYEDIIKQILIIENGINKQEEILKKIDDDIKNIERELDKIGGVDLKKERMKRILFSKLSDLFNDAISIYREKLRKKVEKDATNLFLRLIHEKDYSGLNINENYGLTIVHKDGKEIPVRSAGAEHIVALSLMGALQKNAPLRGPIIMDSPFGRLDEQHTTNVVKALRDMSEQVILLVYESELRPEIAQNHLLGDLKAEYDLVRVSAKHTNICKRIESV